MARSTRSRAKTPAPPATEDEAPPPDFQVAVRMYGSILGDCYLLRFNGDAGIVNVLIDCGIILGMPGADARAKEIMTDIAAQTGGTLDVLVVTHEHWDHLSGFRQAADVFAGITVKELWLAWTEDERDEDARRLRARRSNLTRLLMRSFAALTQSAPLADEEDGADDPEETMSPLEGVRGLMAFSGIDAFAAAPGAGVPATEKIISDLKLKAQSVRYWLPGIDPFPLPGASEVSVYVLGPPKDETLLGRSRPYKGKGEVYELRADDVFDGFMVAALDSVDSGEPCEVDMDAARQANLPFGSRHLIAYAAARPPPPRELGGGTAWPPASAHATKPRRMTGAGSTPTGCSPPSTWR